MESVILLFLAIAIIPANSFGIYQFNQTKMNKTFFILVIALCCCNLAMGINGILLGFARFMDNHPLGNVGCYLISFGICSITTITMMIQALISYERRNLITKVWIHSFHYRVYILLAVIVVFGFLFWILFFHFTANLTTIPVRFNQNPNSKFYQVCNSSSKISIGFGEATFSLVAFVIPITIIIFNYWFVTLLLKIIVLILRNLKGLSGNKP